MSARVERVVTSGQFELDGGCWDVDNNVWLVGNDDEVIIIDAAHDAQAIVDAVGGRHTVAIILTHGHNDHINAAADVASVLEAPVYLSYADTMLWERVYGDRAFEDLCDAMTFDVAGTVLKAVATPGHSPGSMCLYLPENDVLFSGDTLFQGGPGATGRSFSSFEQIIESIRTRILVLPSQTVVHPGHGEHTTVAAEASQVPAWLARGH